jgi:hypothetical protein
MGIGKEIGFFIRTILYIFAVSFFFFGLFRSDWIQVFGSLGYIFIEGLSERWWKNDK